MKRPPNYERPVLKTKGIAISFYIGGAIGILLGGVLLYDYFTNDIPESLFSGIMMPVVGALAIWCGYLMYHKDALVVHVWLAATILIGLYGPLTGNNINFMSVSFCVFLFIILNRYKNDGVFTGTPDEKVKKGDEGE